MTANEAIRNTLNFSHFVLTRYLDDLTDDDLLKRPGPGCNSVAWQLGHLITAECGLLNMIRPGAAPELPAGFADRYGKNATHSDDPEKFGTKQEYLALTEKVHTATLAVLADYPAADFALPSPEPMRKRFPTMGALFQLIASHPLMHAGQFVPLRRALGKPVVI
jgi:hypothetical protein